MPQPLLSPAPAGAPANADPNPAIVREHAVIIAGAGPTGLMLAAELALAGADVAIVEPRLTQDLIGARAGGLHSRTIEILDQRGIADRFLAAGQTAQAVGFAWIPLDMSDFPTRHPYVLALRQNQIERLLAEWVAELNVPIYRGRAVTGFTETETGLDVALSDGATIRAQFLVGCDGGRSTVRKAAGIAFPGVDASISNLIAEAQMTETPPFGLRRDAHGIHALSPQEDGKGVRVMLTEQNPDRAAEPTLADVSAALVAVYGSDFGLNAPTWISRFTDAARQAATYRKGRVLLAGDAAHIHYPTGGQGLNIGVQDAMNLGWKLGAVVTGAAPETLLDTYHSERHPVAARVLRDTLAQVALLRTDDRTNALREIMTDLLALDPVRKRIAGTMSGLDIHYDFGPGHPLLGRRMPDLDLTTSDGPTRVYALLHAAKPLLLNFDERRTFEPLETRGQVPYSVQVTSYDGAWNLPVLGPVEAPTAVLVRPDGYVVWSA